MVEWARHDAHEFARQIFGWLMRPASEDKLIQLFSLRAYCCHDARMAMAVGGDPPTRNGIEDTASVGCVEGCAFGMGDERYRLL